MRAACESEEEVVDGVDRTESFEAVECSVRLGVAMRVVAVAIGVSEFRVHVFALVAAAAESGAGVEEKVANVRAAPGEHATLFERVDRRRDLPPTSGCRREAPTAIRCQELGDLELAARVRDAEGAITLVEEAFAEGVAFTDDTEQLLLTFAAQVEVEFESIRNAVPACGPTRPLVCVVAF